MNLNLIHTWVLQRSINWKEETKISGQEMGNYRNYDSWFVEINNKKQKERECDEDDSNELTTSTLKESRIPEGGFRNPFHVSGFSQSTP